MLSVVLDVEQLPHTYVWNYKSTSVRHHERSTGVVFVGAGKQEQRHISRVSGPDTRAVRVTTTIYLES